jgi:hypothetical protein
MAPLADANLALAGYAALKGASVKTFDQKLQKLLASVI